MMMLSRNVLKGSVITTDFFFILIYQPERRELSVSVRKHTDMKNCKIIALLKKELFSLMFYQNLIMLSLFHHISDDLCLLSVASIVNHICFYFGSTLLV